MADDLPQPDEYEAEFMDGGDAVHREKMTFPPWFRWFAFLAVLGGLGAGAYSAFQAGDMGSVAMLAALTPVMLFMVTMISTLRVSVTSDHVNVQYGPIGPTIPIDRIEHCEAEDYEFWKYGGYGIRYSPIEGAWCYNMVGDGGKAVRIHYRTKGGSLKKVLIASSHPSTLADAINRARAEKGQTVENWIPDDDALGVDPYDEVAVAEDVVFANSAEDELEAAEEKDTEVKQAVVEEA